MRQGTTRAAPESTIAVVLIVLLVVAGSLPTTIRAQDDSPSSPIEESDPSPAEGSDHPPSDSSPPSATEHRWHAPRKNARPPRWHLLYRTKDDWNPLAGPVHDLKDELEKVGLRFDLDVTALAQRADRVDSGKRTLATVIWELMGDWNLLSNETIGDGYLSWNAFGGQGFNFNAESQTLSTNVGSVSGLNLMDVTYDPIILDELFWKQKIAAGKVIVDAGKIDMSYHFDTNRVANNAFTQFNAYALTNNPSIPFPTFGGFGGIIRVNITDRIYAMAGMGDSSGFVAVAPWSTADNDSWYQLMEVGGTVDVPGLGSGTYRVTPWHNRLFGEDGWGVGINLDQELAVKWLLAFFRYGTGDGDVTPTESFIAGGLALNGLFGRKGDTVAVGVAWSEPNDRALREETLLETYYQLALSPSILLAPSLQVVFNPGAAEDDDTTFIGGARLTIQF